MVGYFSFIIKIASSEKKPTEEIITFIKFLCSIEISSKSSKNFSLEVLIFLISRLFLKTANLTKVFPTSIIKLIRMVMSCKNTI